MESDGTGTKAVKIGRVRRWCRASASSLDGDIKNGVFHFVGGAVWQGASGPAGVDLRRGGFLLDVDDRQALPPAFLRRLLLLGGAPETGEDHERDLGSRPLSGRDPGRATPAIVAAAPASRAVAPRGSSALSGWAPTEEEAGPPDGLPVPQLVRGSDRPEEPRAKVYACNLGRGGAELLLCETAGPRNTAGTRDAARRPATWRRTVAWRIRASSRNPTTAPLT